MKIKLSELKQLIREAVLSEGAIEVYNNDTGEIIDTLTRADAKKYTALRDKAILGGEIFLDDDEYENLMDEIEREALAKRNERLDINKLLARLDDWAQTAAREFAADNPDVDVRDVAHDLADAAEYDFESDEWNKLLAHFEFDEDAMRFYIMDSMVG
jgi:hypothetical protein